MTNYEAILSALLAVYFIFDLCVWRWQREYERQVQKLVHTLEAYADETNWGCSESDEKYQDLWCGPSGDGALFAAKALNTWMDEVEYK